MLAKSGSGGAPPPRRQFIFWQRLTLSLIVVSTLITAQGQSPTGELKFTIALQKMPFKSGEPIVLQMKLENVSDHPIVVNTRFLVNGAEGPHEVVLQVIGPDKTTLPFESLIRASFQSERYTSLQAHQAATHGYHMTDDFDLAQRGTYSVRAYYQNERDAPAQLNLAPAWKGTLESDRVQFTVR